MTPERPEPIPCPSCATPAPGGQRHCGACGAALSREAVNAEIHRQVTIVTSDLKGSTALGESLDPESLREVMTTYIDEMRAVFEGHGGTIEKIIGDAIVAVFGLPTARDDDALRAVEAAAESQRALASLNDRLEQRWGVRLTVRTGVASGDAVVGEASAGQHVLTGPTIAIATAMEQNAPAQEVLLADSTYEAVRDSVEVDPMEPVTPKGRSERIETYRLVSVSEREISAEQAGEPAVRLCQTCGEENAEEHRFCVSCGSELRDLRRVRDTRKTVTVVFADPKPTTADGSSPTAEALRDVMSRYFAGMQRALEGHGATVEKFIGDAVMAVFGLPIRHEDDALRAVRAASDMQDALPVLNEQFEAEYGITLHNHIGVNTGEVVAGDASLGQRLVTGDIVNVAARLEQAAGSREILLGDLTYRLVRHAVEVEPVEPLTLKGKSEPVPAYRLLRVSRVGEGVQRRQDTPMVGREAELEALRGLLQRAVRERACRMATVVGDAGVGKSRLIREFTSAAAADALVIHGRCLPYGDGITFWPLREAVREAAAIGADDAPDEATALLRARVPDAAVVERLASVIGFSDVPFPVPEVFWSARRFLEILSTERPVLLVVDDIHWAEATFLELIGHLVESVEDAPVLLLCTSRYELLERQPDWAQDPASLRLVLSPLTDADAGLVVEGLLGGTGLDEAVRGRIVQAAAGNPLFVEQLLSMLIDEGVLRREDDRWVQAGDLSRLRVPPTIEALLAARLDLLENDERGVIEPAAVIGQNFPVPAVTELVPAGLAPAVPQRLESLTGKQLIQPSEDADEGDAYRFHHLLVRDAAYAGLLKRERAELHERFVTWAEAFNALHGVDNREFEEIHGYHLEQAFRYLMELGTLDEQAVATGQRASGKLASAGLRAMARGDGPAAANLLRRASNLLESDSLERGKLLPRLGMALQEIGEFDEANGVLEEAIRVARLHGADGLEAQARLIGMEVQYFSGDDPGWGDRAMAEVERAVPILEALGDHIGLAMANRVLVGVHGARAQYGRAAEAGRQMIEHARAAEDSRLERRGSIGYSQAALLGPTPVDEALDQCQRLVQEAAGDRRAEAMIGLCIAQLLALRGEFVPAREQYVRSQRMLNDLGRSVVASSTSINAAEVEMLAGDLARAEALLRSDYAELGEMGEQYRRSTIALLLARVLLLQHRIDEADILAQEIRASAAADDVDSQVAWRSVVAEIDALRGNTEEATTLALEALELSRTTDDPRLQGGVHAVLAQVHELAGRDDEGRSAADEARRLYETKGDIVSARALAG
ncbi:MAG TPA: adenylate/guanylate cyclase domain-containing protein [Candidatus Limnocylindria bacterium]